MISSSFCLSRVRGVCVSLAEAFEGIDIVTLCRQETALFVSAQTGDEDYRKRDPCSVITTNQPPSWFFET